MNAEAWFRNTFADAWRNLHNKHCLQEEYSHCASVFYMQTNTQTIAEQEKNFGFGLVLCAKHAPASFSRNTSMSHSDYMRTYRRRATNEYSIDGSGLAYCPTQKNRHD